MQFLSQMIKPKELYTQENKKICIKDSGGRNKKKAILSYIPVRLNHLRRIQLMVLLYF